MKTLVIIAIFLVGVYGWTKETTTTTKPPTTTRGPTTTTRHHTTTSRHHTTTRGHTTTKPSTTTKPMTTTCEHTTTKQSTTTKPTTTTCEHTTTKQSTTTKPTTTTCEHTTTKPSTTTKPTTTTCEHTTTTTKPTTTTCEHTTTTTKPTTTTCEQTTTTKPTTTTCPPTTPLATTTTYTTTTTVPVTTTTQEITTTTVPVTTTTQEITTTTVPVTTTTQEITTTTVPVTTTTQEITTTTVPVTTTTAPVTTTVPQCNYNSYCVVDNLNLDFGDLLKYNIYTYENFTNDGTNPSDVEGRVAVGGNYVVPPGHSIGYKLCQETDVTDTTTCQNLIETCCNGFDTNNLVVRGSTNWSSGRLYYGGSCVGDINHSNFFSPYSEFVCNPGECVNVTGYLQNCFATNTCVPPDSWWDNLLNKLKSISNSLYGLSVNGVTFWETVPTPDSALGGYSYVSPYIWTNHLWLQPLVNNQASVFNVDALDLKEASSFYWAPEPSCNSLVTGQSIGNCLRNSPSQSENIIINVHASSFEDCGINFLDLQDLAPYADRLIWNFGECQNNLILEGVGMYGTIIAPNANLIANGFINGHVFVKSFNGSAQINLEELVCIPSTQILS